MAKNRVKEILQYKSHKNMDYIYVLWDDGLKTWTKLASLSCKELICEFIRKCLKNLREKRRIESELKQKEREAVLLEKIINKNAEANRNQELAINNSNVIKHIIEKSKDKNSIEQPAVDYNAQASKGFKKIAEETFPFLGFKAVNPHFDKTGKPSFKPIPQNYQQNKEILIPVKLYKSASNNNLIKIMANKQSLVDFTMFYKRDEQPLEFDLESACVLDSNLISNYLYMMHFTQDQSFLLLTAEVLNNAAAYTKYENDLRNTKKFLLYVKDGVSWVFYFPLKRDDLFGLKIQSKLFVMRVENSSYLTDLYDLRNIQNQDVMWNSKDYKSGVTFFTDALFANKKLPANLSNLFVGDENSYVGKHIINYVKKNSKFTRVIEDKCNVIIQESYMDYIHQLDGITTILRKNVNFFTLSDFRLVEILTKDVVYTFTDNFICNCNIIDLFDLLEASLKLKTWLLRVSMPVYKAMKKKLSSLESASDLTYKLKLIYKAFKDNCIDSESLDLIPELEKKYRRDYKVFLTIDENHLSDQIVTIKEAQEILKRSY